MLSARTADPTKVTYDISFIDYGNKVTVSQDEVRELSDAAIAAVPPQAHPASLACVQVSALSYEILLAPYSLLSHEVSIKLHRKPVPHSRDGCRRLVAHRIKHLVHLCSSRVQGPRVPSSSYMLMRKSS